LRLTRGIAAFGSVALIAVVAATVPHPAVAAQPSAPQQLRGEQCTATEPVGGEPSALCVGFRPADRAATARLFRMDAAHGATTQAAAPSAAASIWQPDPNPGDVPEFCNIDATRVTMCQAGTVWGNIINTRTGAIVGRADVNVLFWAALSNKSLKWKLETKAVVAVAAGAAATGTILGSGKCSGACTVAASPATPLPLRVGDFMRGSWDITSTTPGAVPVTSGQSIQFTFAAPAVSGTGNASTPNVGKVRCDNSATIGRIAPGCVYPDVDPVFILSGSAVPASPEHAAFVKVALASGKPGAPSGAPLRRLADDAAKKANRDRACKDFVPRPSPPGTPPLQKDSCDEFPFAGTYEGGANTLTEHVPLGDNTNGGNKYATFIRDHRLWDKDEFFIQVVA